MTRDHPVMGYARWFAWYRVPVAPDKTAWLCMVERCVHNTTENAWFAYRMPVKCK